MTENKTIPQIYIAGPYRASTRNGIETNIDLAEEVSADIVRLGCMPVTPHSLTRNQDVADASHDDVFWLDATLELMRRCDAVMLVPGWQDSAGTRGEVTEAKRLGIKVFEEEKDLVQYVRGPGFRTQTQIRNDLARHVRELEDRIRSMVS